MKRHQSIMLTAKLVKSIAESDYESPCRAGMAWAKHFLPAHISTNPEANLPLALKLAQTPAAQRGSAYVHWLAARAVGGRWNSGMWPDGYNNPLGSGIADNDGHYTGTMYTAPQDPTVIAQALALIADQVTRDDGKGLTL